MKHKYFPFYPDAWKGESALRMCSSGARGLWIDMLCEMNSGIPYGHLTTPTGVPITTADQLRRIVGEDAKDVTTWLEELERAQVFSRNEQGVIFCRRMVRDQDGRKKWAQRQERARGRRESNPPDASAEAPISGETDPKSHANVTLDVTPESQESPPLTVTVTGTNREIPNGISVPRGSNGKSVVIPVEPGPTFDDALEPLVVDLIGLMADDNKSGRIAERRIAAERRHIADRIKEFGRDAMAHGVAEAVRAGVGNVMYAVKVAKGYKPGETRPLVAPARSAGPAAVKPEYRDGGWRSDGL